MKAIVRICATPRRTEALWRNDGEICSATLWSASVNVDIEYDIQRSHCAHTRISQRPNNPRFHFSLVETLSLIWCLGPLNRRARRAVENTLPPSPALYPLWQQVQLSDIAVHEGGRGQSGKCTICQVLHQQTALKSRLFSFLQDFSDKRGSRVRFFVMRHG